MKILPNGYFSMEYDTEALSHGARPSRRLPRNNSFLSECKGAVGNEGTLKTLDALTISTMFNVAGVTLADFPFPQLFLLERHIIVCNRASIMENVKGTLTTMISGLTGGGKWNVASSHDFIYASNGTVAVIRDPNTHVWALSSTAPKAMAIGNFNGQVIVGNAK